MSLNTSSRRALAAGLRPARTPRPTTACTAAATTQSLVLRPRTQAPSVAPSERSLHTTPARAIDWGSFFGRGKKAAPKKSSGDGGSGLTGELSRTSSRQKLMQRISNPDLSASPLLAGELEQQGQQQSKPGQPGQPGQPAATADAAAASPTSRNEMGTSLLAPHLQRALDPDPRSRVRWERKMVARHVGRMLDPRGRETREERLARTERALLHKSMPLATSTKKLMHLARQIAGKTLDEALVQMRFSRKKMAKEVLWHLEEARDVAIVERGMGLGRVQQSADPADPAEAAKQLTIRTKDGRWLTITDPTRIYIDQAWVGKGIWRAVTPDYRARGRMFQKWSPSTFLSVVLKEEKTRIRLNDERAAKEAKKAPWVHLPNRPVTAQRPYYSW